MNYVSLYTSLSRLCGVSVSKHCIKKMVDLARVSSGEEAHVASREHLPEPLVSTSQPEDEGERGTARQRRSHTDEVALPSLTVSGLNLDVRPTAVPSTKLVFLPKLYPR